MRPQTPRIAASLCPPAIIVALILAATAGCQSPTDQQMRQTTISESKSPDPELIDENSIRASAKHYTNAQKIPGVGTAVGDVYVLPNGGCFGGAGKSGILYPNKNLMLFGRGVSARNPLHLFEAGSPATKQPGK
jgi:hypothetical protein